jgi:hypothetical protein
MRARWWAVAGACVALVAALGIGLGIVLAGNDRSDAATTTVRGMSWEQLYAAAKVGQKKARVLAKWPKIPYQHYSDNLSDDCYEWQGDNLYDLCFKYGVLRMKTTF